MRKLWQFILFFFLTSVLLSQESILTTEQWATLEITLTSLSDYENSYTDVAVWADFTNQKGDTIKRHAFWDGDNIWKIRFTSPDTISAWKWLSFASNEQDKGLHGVVGSVSSKAYSGNNALMANGLLKMAEGNRNAIQHSGKSFLVVGDTHGQFLFGPRQTRYLLMPGTGRKRDLILHY